MRPDMIGRFQFNNIESDIFNLVCKSVKRPLLPAVKTKRIELPGLSGAYDFDEHEYSLRSVTMRIVYLGTDYTELRTRARDIAAWLSTSNWAKLIIHDEPDKYYLAKVSGEIDLESLWGSGSSDITFDCQPFAYSITESIFNFPVNQPTQFIFSNPGTRVINYKSPPGSKFLIKVVGSWTTLSLVLNGKTLTYTEAGNGTAIFDNVEMEVALNGINKFRALTGDIDTFLHLCPGNNTLQVNGTTLNIIVSIEFIPLWI